MKKFMKVLALALALCMVLSVSAFAAVGETGKTVDTNAHTVTFTVTGLNAGEQVALLVLRDGAELATASESNILYIDQKAVATGATTVDFTATIAASTETVNNDVVDVYVGSQSINSDKSGAWMVYEDVEVANTSSITIAGGAKFVNVDQVVGDKTITRPGAAIGINVNNVSLTKMIWALKGANGDYKYTKSIAIDTLGIENGEVWFTGVFSSSALKDFTIADVSALFRGQSDSEVYFVGNDADKAEVLGDVKPAN